MANRPGEEPGRDLLLQSEERYRLLIESVQDYAIFLLDPDGYVTSWNLGAERIKGYKAEEIIGQHFSRFYPPEDVAAGKTILELEGATSQGRFEDEGWRLRKDGSRFWANVVLTALRDAQGVLRGFAKVTRDLTARRIRDEQARQLAAERAARAEAEAANRRKDEFLATLAHELRNPLATLVHGVTLLRQVGDDPARGPLALDMLDRQVEQLKRLVDDLLESARLTRGRVELHRQRLDLARLARTTVADRQVAFEGAGLSLRVELPQTPVWVVGDGTRLMQVLTNLLDNALKFTDRGGGVEVQVAAEPGGRALLVVRDTGMGIPAELLPRLFEPLTQGDRSLDRPGGGLGLGLAVVKGLVELHSGTVEAVSAGSGRGATFTVYLPLEPEPEALTVPPTGPPPILARPLRVLVIEDNPDAAQSLRLLLELLGHEVRSAGSGPDGVRTAADWQPEVVVSDIGLPGFDGYEVARRIRALPGMGRTPLVALTGYGSPEDRRRGREAGFTLYLVKPADVDDLQRALALELS